ncbi:hypothetical protein Stsp01_39880 [Streptomyces sp. NBRC 13847]|nr:hypothetical protein Stsp01_39880 [Streptomyces sp. NBRC 13847]
MAFFVAAVFFAAVFVAVFFAVAFLAAAGFSGVSFTAAFFPAGRSPTGLFCAAVGAVIGAVVCGVGGRDAPGIRTAGFRTDASAGVDLFRSPESEARPDGCSPTAESRPALTRPAPQSSALTGVLDTRPD